MKNNSLKSAAVHLDEAKCVACGSCVETCNSGTLYMENSKLKADTARGLGCIACGHCMAICPHEAISIEGRDLFPNDRIEMPSKNNRAHFDQLNNLMLARRSTRSFHPKTVEKEIVEKILNAASTAPMGLPPSGVEVIVFDGQEKVDALAEDFVQSMKSMRWILSPWIFSIFKLFMKRETAAFFEGFIKPIIKIYIEKRKIGEDKLFYQAPLAMYFYGTASSDALDAHIAGTYATLAAEALGLGNCIIGLPSYIFKSNRKLREKYGISSQHQAGIMIIFGYPKMHFNYALKRRFKKVSYF